MFRCEPIAALGEPRARKAENGCCLHQAHAERAGSITPASGRQTSLASRSVALRHGARVFRRANLVRVGERLLGIESLRFEALRLGAVCVPGRSFYQMFPLDCRLHRYELTG